MKPLLILLATVLASSLAAKELKDKTIYKNGIYAAAFTELSADSAKINGYQLISPRLMFGMQLYRFRDWFSIGLGLGKVGFQQPKNQDVNDGVFRYDYRGPIVNLNVFPGRRLNIELNYFIQARGSGSEEIPDNTANLAYKYEVEDFNSTISLKVYGQYRLIVGLGQRSFKFETKVTNSDSSTIPGSRPSSGNESGGYLLLGLRASQF